MPLFNDGWNLLVPQSLLVTLPENIGIYVTEVLKVTKTTKTKVLIKVELIKKYN